jgi:hypothetical protein
MLCQRQRNIMESGRCHRGLLNRIKENLLSESKTSVIIMVQQQGSMMRGGVVHDRLLKLALMWRFQVRTN